MRISELLKEQKKTLSFEVFPPKTTDSYESVRHSVMEIAALNPDFMSVTYGAGGGYQSVYGTVGKGSHGELRCDGNGTFVLRDFHQRYGEGTTAADYGDGN